MSSGYIFKKMVKNMKINGVNVKNMTNDQINSFIKQLYHIIFIVSSIYYILSRTSTL